jgi:hypothetical protein
MITIEYSNLVLLEFMSVPPQPQPESPNLLDSEALLCTHCRRTASNGIKCKGLCVADSDY